jgi:peptide/nickel transport system permease protein
MYQGLPLSARLGAVILTAVAAVALLSQIWTPYDISLIAINRRLAPPLTAGYLLGTDALGRDMVTLLMVGAFNSMYVAILGAGAAFLVGVGVAVLAVVNRGWIDELLMRCADIIYANPVILIALVLVAKVGPSRETAILAVMVWFSPVVARVARSAALTVSGTGYVMAARTYGRGPYYIMFRHVLPNIAPVLLVQATVAMVTAIMLEAALSYLGVGTQPPSVSWGRMLHDSQPYFGKMLWLAVWPGLCIAMTVMSLNLLHDGLRNRLDRRAADGAG